MRFVSASIGIEGMYTCTHTIFWLFWSGNRRSMTVEFFVQLATADGSKYFYCYYTKCGKMENLLPTVLVQLVNHSNECKVINMHCIFAACMVICELFCYSIFFSFQLFFFNLLVCFLSHSMMTKYSYCCFIFM